MHELWRTRRWRQLLNLIEHLPRHSFFVEAQLDDDELVAAALAGGSPASKPRRRLSEFSPELEQLATMVDRLGELLRVQIAKAGQQPPKIAPVLRPVTAIDRIRASERERRHLHLVDQLLPGKRG